MSEIRQAPAATRRLEHVPEATCVTTTAWPVSCEDFRASKRFGFEPHAHDEPHVCFVLDGLLVEHEGRMPRTLRPGEARLSPAGDMHHLAVGPEGVRCLVVSLVPRALEQAGVAPLDNRRYVEGRRVRELVGRVRRELRWLDDVSPIALELLALETTTLPLVTSDQGGSATSPPRWVERVRDRLSDEFRSIPTLAELADDAGVGRATLARHFRASYGCTIGRFVRMRRLEAARRLILESDLPLATVASRAGFADQSHMTRMVADRFGDPPGRLRHARARE